MKKKIATFAIIIAIAFSALSGCGKEKDSGIPDGMIGVYIQLFTGGYGTKWLDDYIAEYNKTSELYYFKRNPDNKEVLAETTSKLIGGIQNADIYFTGESNMQELIASGKIENLNELLASKPAGEDKTIAEKIKNYDLFSSVFSDAQNNVYCLPYFEGVSGMIYDHDYFVSNGLLITDPSTANGLSKGVDNIEGTYDDGLPATKEEFIELFNELKGYVAEPIVYSGRTGAGIFEPIAETIWGRFDGITNYNLSFEMNGTYTASNGTQTQITPATGYKMYTDSLAEGRVEAAKLFKEVIMNTAYAATSTVDDLSHTDAQDRFVLSHKNANTRSVVLYSGFWWENESKGTFIQDANDNGEEWGYGKRDFRILPIPSMSGESSQSLNKNYITSHRDAVVFVAKQKDEQKKAAIMDFLKGYASDKNLIEFAKATSTVLPFKVSLPQDVFEHLTPFGKNLITALTDENTIILHPDLMRHLQPRGQAGTTINRWEVTINGTRYNDLYNIVKQKIEVATYKNALQNMYNAQNWIIK